MFVDRMACSATFCIALVCTFLGLVISSCRCICVTFFYILIDYAPPLFYVAVMLGSEVKHCLFFFSGSQVHSEDPLECVVK